MGGQSLHAGWPLRGRGARAGPEAGPAGRLCESPCGVGSRTSVLPRGFSGVPVGQVGSWILGLFAEIGLKFAPAPAWRFFFFFLEIRLIWSLAKEAELTFKVV